MLRTYDGMPDRDAPFGVRREVFDVEYLGSRSRLAVKKLKLNLPANDVIRVWLDEAVDLHVAEISAFFLSRKEHTCEKKEIRARESVPTTWWQHFKARWFPQWALRRWPVQTREIVSVIAHTHITQHICPHIGLPYERGPHFEFLMEIRG